MTPRWGVLLALGALAAGPGPVVRAVDRVPPAKLEPFLLDHRAGRDDGLDLSFLLEAPAGRHGFIARQGGRLADGAGRPIRLWGTNITDWTPGSVQIPSKADDDLWARTLSRFGINIVRLTFLDFTAPRGLIERDRDDTRRLDPAKLDDFDAWIAALKRRGIYVDINLLVGRTFKEGDGVQDRANVGWAKALAYFDPRLIELQKEFARELLTHRNPYTGRTYADEPAVAIVELVNENSLWDAWYYDRLHPPAEWPRDVNFRPTPQYYSDELDRLYNAYLRAHLAPSELSDLRRQAGVPEGRPVPRMAKADWAAASVLRMHAESAFVIDVEQGFFREMNRYFREDLGVRSLLLGSSDYLQEHSNYGMVLANTELDLTDGHVYWEHPSWPGALNSPMVNDPLASTVVRLSRTATALRPYTVTEFNHPWPSDWDCEGLPIASAYAAFQDWSALIVYTFEPKGRPGYQGYVGDAFDISHHPVKMPQMMAGALLYLRGDIAPARETVTRTYSRAQVEESIRLPLYESPYYTPGFPLQLALEHRMRIGSFDGPPTGAKSESRHNPIVSDTGQLAWYTTPFDTGLVTVDSPRSQALVGFVKANRIATSNLVAAPANDFCALTLSSLETAPIAGSARLLLTAGARVENTGFRWNSERTDVAADGRGTSPSLIEVVSGPLTLRGLEPAHAVRVQPLDGAGRPLGPAIAATSAPAGWSFSLGAVPTTWYTIDVDR
jgi:hypothetical protein